MKPVRFLHIPKTGGSTLNSVLSREYPKNREFTLHGLVEEDSRKFAAFSDSEEQGVALFYGHAPIITGIAEADRARTFTFLRDPVARVKSFCQHVSEGKSSYLLKDFPPESFDLDRFLKSGNGELSNLQTKMLINRECNVDTSLIDSMSSAEARDAALNNIFNRLQCYGLQEHYNESLLLIAREFNWRTPYYIPLNTKNRNSLIEFKSHHLEKIRELNTIDSEVYATARKEFERNLAAENSMSNELQRFLFVNSTVVLPANKVRDFSTSLYRSARQKARGVAKRLLSARHKAAYN